MGQSFTNGEYGCSVNFATSLEKAHVVASSYAPFTNNIQDSDYLCKRVNVKIRGF
jgi:hypothetical protein